MHLKTGAEYVAAFRQGFATRRLCLPTSPAQTPSLFYGDVIVCAVLAVLSAIPIPCPHSESRTPRCGCADHHELEPIAERLKYARE